MTKDIDDVAPAGGNGADFTSKDDLAGIPLELRAFRAASGANGEFHIFDAVRLDTGDEIAFTGGQVLDQQGQKCIDGNHFPVNAVIVKEQGPKNPYWKFVSPEKVA